MPPDFTSKWQNNLVTKNSTNHEDSCKIYKTTLDVVARFEKCMVDALKSIHNSNKDEKISQLESDLECQMKITDQALEIKSKMDQMATTIQSDIESKHKAQNDKFITINNRI